MAEICRHTACGGCSMTGIPYEEQLARKHQQLKTLLSPFGEVLPPIGMEEPFYYRNKVTRTFASARDEKKRMTTVAGTYAAESRRVVPIDSCLIEDRGAQRIMNTLTALCAKMKILPYDPKTRSGVIRHAQIRVGASTGEYLLTLVTGTPQFPGRGNLVTALRREHPEITSIVHNVNGFDTGMILGDEKRSGHENRVLFGSGSIRDTLCGLSFRISPQSFYQVNPRGTEILYNTAIALADLQPNDTLLDAYCGIGTIGLAAAHACRRVIGVELNPDAVRDAIANAKHNKITNARFYRGDAGKFLLENADLTPDVLIMDPPRGGSDQPFLNAVCRAKPKKVVYVSCGPDTLARDLKTLTREYRVETIQPVDMFPMTEHCECVVSLRRIKQ
ncbi:MAG: 23S rRNA (uracil(1939)-C(5))-methyltransferase RlmD [Clostridia bacterium]|nr:23S rRNA (uracil(1939)-C(5))-methyltransferase RlmD [Clostridia bacterium]